MLLSVFQDKDLANKNLHFRLRALVLNSESNMPSFYKQFFWKGLEMGAIPDFYTRSKIKSGLQQVIDELDADGNIETHQKAMNDFIEGE